MKLVKKISLLTLVVALIVSLFFAERTTLTKAETDYEVDGGRYTIDFSNHYYAYEFSLYTEFDVQPWWMDNKLYFWSLAEQKAIFSNHTYSDVDISVDICTINKGGKFDSGLYVQGSSFSYHGSGATAWNVNVERDVNSTVGYLKLHRFNNYAWEGIKVEKSVRLPNDKVTLRVVVKSGMLYAFLDGDKKPVFNYFIGEQSGRVGFRSYYTPCYFDNLQIISPNTKIDYSFINSFLSEAEKIDRQTLTADSVKLLEQTVLSAQEAVSEKVNQYRIDELTVKIKKTLSQLTFKRELDELNYLLEKAKSFKNPNMSVYTSNSWNSLQAVIGVCETLTIEDGENEISYWINRLENRIDALTAYINGGVQ